MAETKTCPKCGAELPSNAPAGICPKCLMQAGLASEQDAGSSPEAKPTTPSPGFVPPEPKELAEYFPQLEILELLGKGGMGAVYKARQPGLDRLVALKILPPEVGADAAFAKRFTREARALARLNHPNIVHVYEFGQVGSARIEVRRESPTPPKTSTEGLPEHVATSETFGRPSGSVGDRPQQAGDRLQQPLYYFIMEYVDGTNLRDVIQTSAIQPAEALAIVPQICEALQFAHDQGIVHRDIKPENILVDRQGRVKIADFGLAKLMGTVPAEFTLTGSHQAMGTVHYMAPEQMRGAHDVDHRADIYSLGVVFYEMLTGELPIGRFEPPSHKVQVDVRLDEVVLRALESQPERRYQQVSEVKTEVERVSQQSVPFAPSKTDTVAIPPDSDSSNVPRDGDSSKRVARWILLASAVLALAGALAYVRGRTPEPVPLKATAREATLSETEQNTPGLSVFRYELELPPGFSADFSAELWRQGKREPCDIHPGARIIPFENNAVQGTAELRLQEGETLSPLNEGKLRWDFKTNQHGVTAQMGGWMDDPFTGMQSRSSPWRGTGPWPLTPGKEHTLLILQGWKEPSATGVPEPLPFAEDPTAQAKAIRQGVLPRADVELYLKVRLQNTHEGQNVNIDHHGT